MPRKKKNRVPKSETVWHRTAEEATLDKMPKFNAHACGTGAHGDAKYNRAKQKRSWQRELANEGARDCGRLSFALAIRRLIHSVTVPSIQPFIPASSPLSIWPICAIHAHAIISRSFNLCQQQRMRSYTNAIFCHRALISRSHGRISA